ncbi:hypothetical protein M3J07_009530 [Ascochyta lentis]
MLALRVNSVVWWEGGVEAFIRAATAEGSTWPRAEMRCWAGQGREERVGADWWEGGSLDACAVTASYGLVRVGKRDLRRGGSSMQQCAHDERLQRLMVVVRT